MSIDDYRWGRHPEPEKKDPEKEPSSGKNEPETPKVSENGSGPAGTPEPPQKPEEPRRPQPESAKPESRSPGTPDGASPSGRPENTEESSAKKSGKDLDAEWKAFNDLLQSIWANGEKNGAKASGPEQTVNRPGASDSPREDDIPQIDRSRRSSRIAALVAIVTIFSVGAYLGAGFYSVPSGETAALYATGQFKGLVGPGTHWHFPWPFEKVRMVDTRLVHSQDVSFSGKAGEGYLLTADGSFVSATATVKWQVASDGVRNYLEHMVNPSEVIDAALRRALRQEFTDMTVHDVLSGRAALLKDDLAKRVQKEADSLGLGVHIESVSVTNAGIPTEVREASRVALEAQNAGENAFGNAQRWAELAGAMSVNTSRAILENAESYRERVVRVSEMDSRYISYLYGEKASDAAKRDAIEQAWNAGLAAALPNKGSIANAKLDDLMAVIRAAKPKAPEGKPGEESAVPVVTEAQIIAQKKLDAEKKAAPAAASSAPASSPAAEAAAEAAASNVTTPGEDPANDRESTTDRRDYLRNRGR